jgi:hypothetical protein
MMQAMAILKKIFIPCQENNYFPGILDKKILNSIFILLLILKIFTIPLIFTLSKSLFFAEITKSALLEYLNSERKARNLPILVENQKLDLSATLKAKDILEKDYFAHRSPDGISPWYWFRVSGYDYQFAGENLAIGFLDSKEVHDAWMNSPSHRQNILNPNYQEIGIAVLKGEFNGNEVYVVVQHFGRPKEKAKVEEKILPKPETQKISLRAQTSTQAEVKTQTSTQTEIVSGQTTTKELITSTQVASQEVTIQELREKEVKPAQKITFNLAKFVALKYSSLLNGIIYFILAIMIFSLTLTIYLDTFVYRKFMVDYKELVPRWVSFCLILLVFLYLDQTKLVQAIPHEFMIYGF